MTGMTRGSPVNSWYCVSALSMTMRGHQSSLDAGPIMPLGAWWLSVQSIYVCALALRRASSSKPRERDKSVEEVRSALPRFARAAEPAAVGADVGPGFVEMSAQAVGLNLELARSQPAGRTDPSGRG